VTASSNASPISCVKLTVRFATVLATDSRLLACAGVSCIDRVEIASIMVPDSISSIAGLAAESRPSRVRAFVVPVLGRPEAEASSAGTTRSQNDRRLELSAV
jgi:hypothetical protein